MTFSSLFSVIFVATIAVASPLIFERDNLTTNVASGPLKTIVTTTSGTNIIARDRARLQVIAGPKNGSGNDIFGTAKFDASAGILDSGFLTSVEVQVGNPPTAYELLIDTGSSNTWIGANKPYVPTSSSQDTGDSVSATYGSGEFTGEEFTDDVTVGGLMISSQSIGVANQSQGFQSVDGILGLGPDGLTVGTLTNEQSTTIPTIIDNAVSQGKAASALVGISIPLASVPNAVGSIDFGTPDSSKFVGDIVYVPVSTTSPANNFWAINQSITYGNDNVQILPNSAGIVDTGTTLFELASDAFQAYISATGAVLDQKTNFLKIDNPESLQSLFFMIGDQPFELTANAQIWPHSLNSAIGGDNESTYLITSASGNPSGSGLDFVIGSTVLQRFYCVFDTTNARVGFANTWQTFATSN